MTDTSSTISEESVENKRTPPYSIFTGFPRILLMVQLSFIGIWSSVSNSIYFPAIPTLTRAFHTSSEQINLSLVAYLICQGVVPTFSSNMTDSFGRRPIILACFAIYIGACIGISQCNTYWLLVFLRCIQAAGIAPVIAINSGISGDVCTAADRGGFVGVISGMLLVGQAFGSLLGSAFISRWDWRAIFLFLAIGSGVTMVFLIILLPETCRSIVGNGSILPPLPYRAPLLLFPSYKKLLTNDTTTLSEKLSMDLLAPFKIIMDLQVIAVLVAGGFVYASWTMSLTSLSTVLEGSKFNYSIPHVGLMYLPQGICSLVGSISAGKTLNMYYSYKRQKYEERYTKEQQQHIPFNRIRVRLDCSILPFVLTFAGLLLLGWCLDRTTNVAAAVVGTCFISFGTACFLAIVTTMLVDLHPGQGSASTSCVNIVRCLLAAAGVAALDKMTESMGVGGCYTVMAGLCLLSYTFLLFVVYKYLKLLKQNAEVYVDKEIVTEDTKEKDE